MLTVFLFAASMLASVHYYMQTSEDKSIITKTGDSAYRRMESDVDSIDTQIKQLLDLAQAQRSKRYITASNATLKEVDRLRAEKAQASGRMTGYKPGDSSEPFYGMVSKFFGCSSETAKSGMYLFLSSNSNFDFSSSEFGTLRIRFYNTTTSPKTNEKF
jgi:hypothetical protein